MRISPLLPANFADAAEDQQDEDGLLWRGQVDGNEDGGGAILV